jgi:hypothetical protein
MGGLKDHGEGLGEVKRMFTSPQVRGQRVGAKLLQRIEALAHDKGLSRIVLETGEAPAFADAYRVYERAGFNRCGAVLDYPDSGFSRFYEKKISDERSDKTHDWRSARNGALEGIPLGIKDLFCTEGVHTQACSHILDGFKPTYESTVTANLWARRRGHAGQAQHGRVRHGLVQRDQLLRPGHQPVARKGSTTPTLVPGGSSGGSAAAVAAGSAPARRPPIPAARSASRPPSPAPSASSRPMAAARAGASSPSPPRSTRPGRSRATCATRRSCCVDGQRRPKDSTSVDAGAGLRGGARQATSRA